MTGDRLVVTADDYGLTDATCRAILQAHHRGVVTATSVLAVVPDLEARLALLDDAPDLSVGVHLAVVGEDPPLLTAREVPTLVDRHGRFRRSWRELLPRLALGRVDLEDLRRELGAQLERVAAARPPTHLDTHQHIHLWPSVGELVVDLALRHGIGAVRVPRSASSGLRGRGIARLADRLAARAGAAGLATTARFRGLDEAGGWNAPKLVAALEDLARGSGSVEVNLHPGAATDAERDRYGWGYHWSDELAAATDPRVRSAVERLGFELVGR
ncbi:MAG: ChbG/HpnK family deacetylase [Acidimicrobiales bacterium]